MDDNNFLALYLMIGDGDKLESSSCIAPIGKRQLTSRVDKCPVKGIDEDRNFFPAASRP